MARETVIHITDDIDGSKGAEEVSFAYQGTEYRIDLGKKNKAALEKALKPYIDAGTKATRRTQGRARNTSSGRRDLAAVRDGPRLRGLTYRNVGGSRVLFSSGTTPPPIDRRSDPPTRKRDFGVCCPGSKHSGPDWVHTPMTGLERDTSLPLATKGRGRAAGQERPVTVRRCGDGRLAGNGSARVDRPSMSDQNRRAFCPGVGRPELGQETRADEHPPLSAHELVEELRSDPWWSRLGLVANRWRRCSRRVPPQGRSRRPHRGPHRATRRCGRESW